MQAECVEIPRDFLYLCRPFRLSIASSFSHPIRLRNRRIEYESTVILGHLRAYVVHFVPNNQLSNETGGETEGQSTPRNGQTIDSERVIPLIPCSCVLPMLCNAFFCRAHSANCSATSYRPSNYPPRYDRTLCRSCAHALSKVTPKETGRGWIILLLVGMGETCSIHTQRVRDASPFGALLSQR